MAKVIYVKPEHRDVLREYLGAGDGGVVLLMNDEVVKKAEASGIDDGDSLHGYDFGGDADLWVEVVSSADHYAFDTDCDIVKSE